MPTATQLLAAQLDEAYRGIRERVEGLTDEEFFRQPGEEWPTWRVLWTMIDHDLHHGGEIGVLRDLYRGRKMVTTSVPASGARA